MGQDPDTIRQQIAETRAEMEDTVDALGYKADVKARAKENVQEKVGAVTGKVSAAKEKIVGQAPSASDVKDQFGQTVGGAKESIAGEAESAKQTARQAASVAQQNPIGLAIGAAAIGFLGGLLIPSTPIEEEKIGPIADQLKEQVSEVGHEAVERGKAVASEVSGVVKDAATDAASAAKEKAAEPAAA